MPYKRMRSGAYVGGRRYVRRRVSAKRMSRNVRGRIYGRSRTKRGARPKFLFHRWCTLPVYSTVTAGPGLNFSAAQCTYSATTGILTVGTNINQPEWDLAACFSLNDIPNVAEFTNLFDQYKLNAVMFQIKMTNVPENINAPNGNSVNYGNFYPTLWYAPDHDDNNTRTIAQLKEYDRARHKTLRPNKEINILLRPSTLQGVYNNSTIFGYACNFKKPWLDMAYPSMPHFGLKFAIDFEGLTTAATTAQAFQFKINAKYYFSCKNTR